MAQLDRFKIQPLDIANPLLQAEQIKNFRQNRDINSERLKGMKSQNFLLQKGVENYPEDRANILKKRQWEDEDRQRAIKKHAFKDELDALEYLHKSANMINYDNYEQAKQHFEELGMHPDFLPPIDTFGPRGSAEARAAFDKFKTEGLVSISQQIDMMKAQKKTGSDSEQLTIYGPNGQTKRIPVKKGETYTPPKGWSLSKPTKSPSDKNLTEDQVREKIKNVGLARDRINRTGGLDDVLFTMLAKSNPELANDLKGQDKKAALNYLDEYESYLRKKLPADSQKYKRLIFKDGKFVNKP